MTRTGVWRRAPVLAACGRRRIGSDPRRLERLAGAHETARLLRMAVRAQLNAESLGCMRNRILLALLVGVLVVECDRREPPAVFRYPSTRLAIRIERTPMHAFLAEYRRTLVVDREGREVVR